MTDGYFINCSVQRFLPSLFPWVCWTTPSSTVDMMKLWHSVDNILALDDELIVKPADKSKTSHAALTGLLLSNSQQHCGLCMAAAHVQITSSDRGSAGSAACPPWIRPLLLAAGVRLDISVVLGRGEGSKARRVSEHLESACAGERSGGQRWRKPSENNWKWEWW